MTAATVFIVDDDAAVRDGLVLLCETAGLTAASHDSAESFLAAFRPDQPGCLVLDVRMGGMSGPELHAELNHRGIHLPVIYLTAHGDIPMTVRAMKAGAADFLTKPVDGATFLERVQAALRLSSDRFVQQESQSSRRQRLAELTPREREIMQLMLAGQANKVIAKHLGISHRTVEIHRSRILRKTGTASLLELAQLAADCGLVPENPAQAAPLSTAHGGGPD
jgi:FixJ family two-component response regulator